MDDFDPDDAQPLAEDMKILAENVEAIFRAKRWRSNPQAIKESSGYLNNGSLHRLRKGTVKAMAPLLEFSGYVGIPLHALFTRGLVVTRRPDGMLSYETPGGQGWPFEEVDASLYFDLKPARRLLAQGKIETVLEGMHLAVPGKASNA